ncbi:MAG: DUF1178 family protein [Pseudorhodobacter sp.]|nr:DUF1178 family protein [Pseudorhodobacter sp.]
MIRYTLRCDREHSFESWFPSAEGFERLHGAGLLSCAVCGTSKVEKTLMAPAVRPARAAGEAGEAGASAAADGALSTPGTAVEQALLALRQHLEANSDYVGLNFAAEARAMHEGARPERPIHGEARLEEARALLEDGVPVSPLPFLPRRKVN